MKKTKLLLFFILTAFFVRELFLIAVLPIFRGQDEARHYNTVQYLATGMEKNCQFVEIDGVKTYKPNKQNKKDLSTYRYSDEIREVAHISQIAALRGEEYEKISFSFDYNGVGENEFKKQKHSRQQSFCPPDIATSAFGKDYLGWYHRGLVWVENLLQKQDIFVRVFSLRIISALLGTSILWLAYHIFRTIDINTKQSLLLTAIISFLPKFSGYFTNINYDSLLIFTWTFFTFWGVKILRFGWTPKRAFGIVVALLVGIFTKPTALPLLGALLFLFWRAPRKELQQLAVGKFLKILFSGGALIALYNLSQKAHLGEMFSNEYLSQLFVYLSKSLPKIYGSSRDYWGVTGWGGTNLTMGYVYIIWFMEWLAWIGLFVWVAGPYIYKLSERLSVRKALKKTRRALILNGWIARTTERKKYFWFMLLLIVLLQVAVRVADWKIFVGTHSLVLGTPGRYWLPNVVPHFALLLYGWRVLFVKIMRFPERWLEFYLQAFLVLTILYWHYKIFDIVIPRIYL